MSSLINMKIEKSILFIFWQFIIIHMLSSVLASVSLERSLVFLVTASLLASTILSSSISLVSSIRWSSSRDWHGDILKHTRRDHEELTYFQRVSIRSICSNFEKHNTAQKWIGLVPRNVLYISWLVQKGKGTLPCHSSKEN